MTLDQAEGYLRARVLELLDVERVFREAKHDLVADHVREALEAFQAARRQMLEDEKERLRREVPECSEPRYWPN